MKSRVPASRGITMQARRRVCVSWGPWGPGLTESWKEGLTLCPSLLSAGDPGSELVAKYLCSLLQPEDWLQGSGGQSKETHCLFLQSSRWNYLNSTSCRNPERMPVGQKWWGIQRLKVDGIWLTRKSNQRKNPGENQGECAFFRELCGCSKLINKEGRSWVLGHIMCV